MFIDDSLPTRLIGRLGELYGDRAEGCLAEILARLRQCGPMAPRRKTTWDQRDVVLIAYGDQVRRPGAAPLRCLGEFLGGTGLDRLLGTVHVLPFFPYSSDDGFSVIDYRAVDPALGDWSDVAALGQRHDLMFDLVVNHASRRSRWFQNYVAGVEPYTRYFIEVDPRSDLSAVARPRSLPLLTPVETSRGTRHLWTTFSDDQFDLNFAEPQVLLEIIDVLLFYLRQGARIIRLDAIAYLWKRPGTSCIHLPETHTVVKLLRDVVDAVSPGTILLTETNVPHRENFSYFGQGDEARMVYQFSLAPLLLEAILSGDAMLLMRWLAELEPTPPGTTVLNFTASHDGIGLRPMEGIMPPERLARLVETVRRQGGLVSTRRNPDGNESPYELNVSYYSALAQSGPLDTLAAGGSSSREAAVEAGTEAEIDAALSVRRFLASQALMLALRGIPGVYFHSLVGTPNDMAGVQRTGRARSINRRKFELSELQAELGAAGSAPAMVLDGYRRLLQQRIAQPAFHPEAAQQVVDVGDPSLVGFLRTSLDDRQRILVLANVGSRGRTVDVRRLSGSDPRQDLLSEAAPDTPLRLAPYQVCWLPL